MWGTSTPSWCTETSELADGTGTFFLMTTRATPGSSPLRHLDAPALRDATRAELRSRQNHLPPISVYRWWARRSETVTGAIIDAIARDRPGSLTIADPFAGGGVIGLAALLRGHKVYAQDVNPWAVRGLTTMTSLPDPADLESASGELRDAAACLLRDAYATSLRDGTPAEIAHTFWLAQAPCRKCRRVVRLFPGALVSLDTRVDCGGQNGFVACRAGHMHHADASRRTRCRTCARHVDPDERYLNGREYTCTSCGHCGPISEIGARLSWSPILAERVAQGAREIDVPTAVERAQASDKRWRPKRDLGTIERGPETNRLTSMGFSSWHDLYPSRQRVVLETLLDRIDDLELDDRTRNALIAVVIGATEIAGRAARWDPRYLKVYETIANHRFNATTLAVEPNVWGAGDSGRGTIVRRVRATAKASLWLDEHIGRTLHVDGPVPVGRRRGRLPADLDLRVVEGSSARLVVPDASLDFVVTDPPYHDDVHYGELSNIFRAWADLPLGSIDGDVIVARGAADETTKIYRAQLEAVFSEVSRALKPNGHLILSYANRAPIAWVALFGALQAAGFHALGYEVVVSENADDYAKAGRRSCNLDVLLDLVVTSVKPKQQHRARSVPKGDEGQYCRQIGDAALRIGDLPEGWEDEFVKRLREARFLSANG